MLVMATVRDMVRIIIKGTEVVHNAVDIQEETKDKTHTAVEEEEVSQITYT